MKTLLLLLALTSTTILSAEKRIYVTEYELSLMKGKKQMEEYREKRLKDIRKNNNDKMFASEEEIKKAEEHRKLIQQLSIYLGSYNCCCNQ